MIRALAKTTLCQGLAWARLRAWVARGEPLVAGYHLVSERDPAGEHLSGMAVSVRMLERHLDWIGQQGYQFVTLDELGDALVDGRRAVAAVTFDDGYAGVARHALPLLQRKGIPFAVFVCTMTAGTGAPFLHDRLFRALSAASPGFVSPVRLWGLTRELLATRPREELVAYAELIEGQAGVTTVVDPDALPFGWNELAALHAAGVIVGSHTRTHVPLTGGPAEVSWACLESEVAGSRRILEERLRAPVRHFAYPDGQFDAATVRAVEAAGYRYAYTCCRHRDATFPRLTIPRVMLWEQSSLDARGRFSGAVLACQALGDVPFLGRCPRRHDLLARA